MKITVLCGGLSTERNISFLSGTKVCRALRDRGHSAVLVDLFLGLEEMGADMLRHPWKLFDVLPPLEEVTFDGKAPDLAALRASRKDQSGSVFGPGVLDLCRFSDVVFLALHGGCGEDGRVQAALDMMGIPYTGSGHLGCAMTMDKMITKKMVQAAGVLTPAWREYHRVKKAELPFIAQATQVPCVVKTPAGGSSVGVVIVKERQELLPALEQVFAFSADILIEQYIEGKEFTNAVLRDRWLPCVEINPVEGEYDYSNKYNGVTEEICPGRLPKEQAQQMGETALLVHRVMGLRTYSRSDFMITKEGEIYFLEVNTLPGMTDTSLVPQEAAAAGISYEELCEIIVKDGIKNCGAAQG